MSLDERYHPDWPVMSRWVRQSLSLRTLQIIWR